jgi:hypothetical protein
MNRTFTSVDDSVLKMAIAAARKRLVFIAPGIRPPVAEALADAMDNVPNDAIHLVLDVDAEVCRLGYGDKEFKGFEILQSAAARHGLTVNRSHLCAARASPRSRHCNRHCWQHPQATRHRRESDFLPLVRRFV